MKIFLAISSAIALAATSVSANAATKIDAINNGWFNTPGPSQIDNFNTLTGWGVDSEFRSFYAFDLSSITEAAAEISITFYGDNYHFGYLGVYTDVPVTEHVSLFDYTGPVSSLIDRTGGLTAFNDLGTGSLLGEATLSGPGPGPAKGVSLQGLMPQFTIKLSNAFVSQFNAALQSQDKSVALGAALDGKLGVQNGMWVASGQEYRSYHPAAFLTITPSSAVPEPATWAMMLFGFGLVGIGLRRRPGKSLGTALRFVGATSRADS